MSKRWNDRFLVLILALLLTACSPIGLQQSVTPQHSLAQDGGVRLTFRAACPPTSPACNLAKERDAAVGVLARRLAGRSDVHDPVVRADGSTNIIVELPGSTGSTGSTQIADIITLLTTSGTVAILDTGSDILPSGTNVISKMCSSACAPGQYHVAFTGDQIDRNQVAAQPDNQSGQWVVQFAFAGSARQQFASYTAAHIGEYLTIAVDNVVVESATIQSEIDNSCQISGMTEADARQLAANLKLGALPAVITVVSSDQVTPSAG
jgi:preprotein translocase subunit SecD